MISVDTKKKELVDACKNAGQEWLPGGEPVKVKVHDFIDKELGRANPYGVYDIGADQAWVIVGTDHVEGLQKPRNEKRAHKLLERIGRLKHKSRGAGQHDTVNLVTDASGKTATALTWEKKLMDATMATHPGVNCLRGNEVDWDEEKLWRTYTLLTELESVFRSLKNELGCVRCFTPGSTGWTGICSSRCWPISVCRCCGKN